MNRVGAFSRFQRLFLLMLLIVVATGASEVDDSCGYFSSEQGCPAGCATLSKVIQSDESYYCIFVPPGYYSGEGRTNFVPCGWGEYSPAYGGGACLPCPAGSFTDAFGSTHCRSCPSSSYQDETGQRECKPCDSLYYGGDGSNGVIKDAMGVEFCTLVTDSPSSSPSSTTPFNQASDRSPTSQESLPDVTNVPPAKPARAMDGADESEEESPGGWPRPIVIGAISCAIMGFIFGAVMCTGAPDWDWGAIGTRKRAEERSPRHQGDDTPNFADPEAPMEFNDVYNKVVQQRRMELEEYSIDGSTQRPQLQGATHHLFIEDLHAQGRHNNPHAPSPPGSAPPTQKKKDHQAFGLRFSSTDEAKIPDSSFETIDQNISSKNRYYEWTDVKLDDADSVGEGDYCGESESNISVLNDSAAATMSPGSAARLAQEQSLDEEDASFAPMNLSMSPMSGISQGF